ncbi:MAG: OmpA family protein [Acidimicrobiales bacterium]
MEVAENPDPDEPTEAKLFPDWHLSSGDQILVVASVVFAVLVLLVAWSIWRNGSGGDPEPGPAGGPGSSGSVGAEIAAPATIGSAVAPGTIGSAVAVADVGDIQSIVDQLPGNVGATTDGSMVRLEGYVANRAESDEAQQAVLAVGGVESVDNRLVLLEGAVTDALDGYGVADASATGVGTDMTVRGTLGREADRRGAIDAAFEVPGVTEVVDRLTVDVTGQLNDLPQVQFATGSPRILAVSFGELDRAAALLVAHGGRFEIQGYTDTVGEAEPNRALSAARADAVRLHLVDSGVDPAKLTAVGYGETDRFAPGSSPEALAANRVVRFEPIG